MVEQWIRQQVVVHLENFMQPIKSFYTDCLARAKLMYDKTDRQTQQGHSQDFMGGSFCKKYGLLWVILSEYLLLLRGGGCLNPPNPPQERPCTTISTVTYSAEVRSVANVTGQRVEVTVSETLRQFLPRIIHVFSYPSSIDHVHCCYRITSCCFFNAINYRPTSIIQ